jgi:hypothetical protein
MYTQPYSINLANLGGRIINTVSNSPSSTYLVTSDGSLFKAVYKTDTTGITQITSHTSLLQPNEQLISVYSNFGVYYVGTNFGRVIAWGDNSKGLLGQGNTNGYANPVVFRQDTVATLTSRVITKMSEGANGFLIFAADVCTITTTQAPTTTTVAPTTVPPTTATPTPSAVVPTTTIADTTTAAETTTTSPNTYTPTVVPTNDTASTMSSTPIATETPTPTISPSTTTTAVTTSTPITPTVTSHANISFVTTTKSPNTTLPVTQNATVQTTSTVNATTKQPTSTASAVLTTAQPTITPAQSTTIDPALTESPTTPSNQTVSITVYDLNNGTMPSVIPGADIFDLSNSTLGTIALASEFNASTKARRALSTKGGYNFQDRVAFVKFSIDPSTTSGNIIELWMYASESKFVQTAISISPDNGAKTISVAYSASNTTTQQPVTSACNFVMNRMYQLKLRMEVATKWTIYGELYYGSTVICAVSMTPLQFSPSTFFKSTFTFVLSQSSSGTGLKRTITAAVSETISVQVSQLGVECVGSSCVTTAAKSTAKKTDTSTLNIGMISGIAGSVAGALVIVALVTVLIVAMAVKRKRRKQVQIYEQETDQSDDEQTVVESVCDDDLSEIEPRKYDAFANDRE